MKEHWHVVIKYEIKFQNLHSSMYVIFDCFLGQIYQSIFLFMIIGKKYIDFYARVLERKSFSINVRKYLNSFQDEKIGILKNSKCKF